jgi:pimeloyl-ACP methyl ester carboxylesterase
MIRPVIVVRGPGMNVIRAALLAIVLFVSISATAQDYAREQRWADEVVPGVVVGDPLWLTLESGHRFLNLYAPAQKAMTAIVLLHGVGVHPDHGLVGILRAKLNELGYTTLSVQMPVAKGEGATVDDYYPALFPQAAERIATAARYLQSQGYERIVLVGHSMGAWMSNVYLRDTPDHPFAAWIVLGLTGRFWGASLISIPWLNIEWLPGRIRLPILDVHGEYDLAPVLQAARARAAALRHSEGSEQLMMPGANHHHADRENQLAQAIHRFISTRVKSASARSK